MKSACNAEMEERQKLMRKLISIFTRITLFCVVKKILREEFVDERVTIKPSTVLVDDLGLDSLEIVELESIIEERFNIDFTSDKTVAEHTSRIMLKHTINDIVQILEEELVK